MSYQQTRSTQDAAFYPLNITNALALTNAANPLVPPKFSMASSPGKPPTYEEYVESTQSFTFPGAIFTTYTAPSADERVLIEYNVNVLGTSGAINGLVASQYQQLVATTIANNTDAAFGSAGTIATSIPGFGLSQVNPGNTVVLLVSALGAGTASISILTRVSRASA